ncbi:MAG TPA: hypothetical protein VL137_16385 [Polyangiaceae bacterium]|nr:hypothetical protein [Polyangiaceae bacterium]
MKQRGLWRGSFLVLGAVVMLPLVASCGKLGKGPGIPGVPGGSCPSDPSAIASASWGLSADVESKLKAGLTASANLKSLAGKIEGDVTVACSQLAKDLGATDADLTPKENGPGKQAETACNVAAKLVGELKAKATAHGQAKLVVKAKEPVCHASMDAAAKCAAECDATVTPGSAKVECEGGKISGTCDGKCEGSCTVEAGAKCEGSCSAECSGTCEAGFSGSCGGKCDGKCDGNTSKGGTCSGTCEGKCSAQAKGTCSGTCSGSCSGGCEMKAKGSCSGSCSGKCDVEMKAPQCSGEVKPPKMSAECQGNCDAKLSAELECTPPMVQVTFEGKADVQAAAKLRTALEADLPKLLKVAVGMKASAEKALVSVKASVEGVAGAIKADSSAVLKAGACIEAAMQAQVEASASINVSIKASASASASASTG